LCPAIALLIRLRYLDGAVRIGGLDQLAAAARDAEDVRHFISERNRALTRRSWVLLPFAQRIVALLYQYRQPGED
jgi:hypothetical protein